MENTIAPNKNPVLKSIDEEQADCIAAFKGAAPDALTMHCHHGDWLELLHDTPLKRINYMRAHKPTFELALRFRLFRPFLDESKLPADIAQKLNAYREARKVADAAALKHGTSRIDTRASAVYWSTRDDLVVASVNFTNALTQPEMVKLHEEICGCPWNGDDRTIFGPEVE